MATDIAFAVSVLVLLGSRIPKTVLTFLVGLAIVDDLGAVVVIAIFLLSALSMAVIGVILERLAYRPLREAPRLSAVVSALGASLVIQNGIMLIWGPRCYSRWLRKWMITGTAAATSPSRMAPKGKVARCNNSRAPASSAIETTHTAHAGQPRTAKCST